MQQERPQNSAIGADAAWQHCQDYFHGLFETQFFKCLNDETRQRIILVSGQGGKEGLRVADIAEHFNLDRSTISHHLMMLRTNNLLKVTRRGRERYYSVNTEYIVTALEEAASMLEACCK